MTKRLEFLSLSFQKQRVQHRKRVKEIKEKYYSEPYRIRLLKQTNSRKDERIAKLKNMQKTSKSITSEKIKNILKKKKTLKSKKLQLKESQDTNAVLIKELKKKNKRIELLEAENTELMEAEESSCKIENDVKDVETTESRTYN